jgi:hypothetical protein
MYFLRGGWKAEEVAQCRASHKNYIRPVLTHSSPSSRFRTGKIADFYGLLDHVCALLKVNTLNDLYLCFRLQKTKHLYHIYNPLKGFKVSNPKSFNISHYTVVTLY